MGREITDSDRGRVLRWMLAKGPRLRITSGQRAAILRGPTRTNPQVAATPKNVESPLARASRLLSEEQDAWIPCPACSGEPSKYDDPRFGCDHCHGGGQVTAQKSVKEPKCSECGGGLGEAMPWRDWQTVEMIDDCTHCNGTGIAATPASVESPQCSCGTHHVPMDAGCPENV
jgi:hypothetical protein